jgi:glycosyltransferase involved in cell wall biosynthesis
MSEERKAIFVEVSDTRISIVVAALNSAPTLQRCIDSVTGQDYLNKELIVMDGGSTDGSVDIIKASEHLISYWKSEPDRGVYHAWNKALDHVTGEWIHFLGSDDYLYSNDVLSRISERLRECDPEIRVVYGRVAICSASGDFLSIENVPWQQCRDKFRESMAICHPGIFSHESMFESHGKFDESFKISGDYEFLLRELVTGSADFVPDVVVAAFHHGGISTFRKYVLLRETERIRAKKLNGLRVWTAKQCWTYAKSAVIKLIYEVAGNSNAIRIQKLYRRLTFGKPL